MSNIRAYLHEAENKAQLEFWQMSKGTQKFLIEAHKSEAVEQRIVRINDSSSSTWTTPMVVNPSEWWGGVYRIHPLFIQGFLLAFKNMGKW